MPELALNPTPPWMLGLEWCRPLSGCACFLQDLLTNPLIVPVKILRGHERVDHEGVLDCQFHPTQPWIFTAGADKDICLFCN